jgi:hypothetical protein
MNRVDGPHEARTEPVMLCHSDEPNAEAIQEEVIQDNEHTDLTHHEISCNRVQSLRVYSITSILAETKSKQEYSTTRLVEHNVMRW